MIPCDFPSHSYCYFFTFLILLYLPHLSVSTIQNLPVLFPFPITDSFSFFIVLFFSEAFIHICILIGSFANTDCVLTFELARFLVCFIRDPLNTMLRYFYNKLPFSNFGIYRFKLYTKKSSRNLAFKVSISIIDLKIFPKLSFDFFFDMLFYII